MYDENIFNDDLNYFDNQSIIEFKESFNYDIKNINEEDDEEDIKSQKELMYDIIQDNYSHIKNSLLILRKRLIYNQNISGPLDEIEVKNFLNVDEVLLKKRKIKKPQNKHSKFSYDNMFYKIKVIYHKFIVSLTNDIYNNCNSNPLNKVFIRKISGQITQNGTKCFNINLGELTLKEFLSKSISSQYSKSLENVNRNNIENIYNNEDKYQKLINLLNYKYKDFYQNFYIKDNCVELIKENFNVKERKYFSFNEIIDNLSKKENKEYINKFVYFAKNKFIPFLEGKRRRRKKILYDTKLKDLFNNNENNQ